MLTPFWKQRKFRIIHNYFNSPGPKRALVSALNRPFLKGVHFKHNNQTEALEMAQVFHELGYQVDVINHDNTTAIDYAGYDVVFGWGAPLDQVFLRESTRLPKTILYMCGAYSPIASVASLKRAQAVYRRRGVWLPGSARLGMDGIGVASVADGVLILGNEVNAGPVRALTGNLVEPLPLFFHAMVDASDILAARDLAQTRRHFMWFSGTGLVHKGLDLVLEAFARHPELHLHVYGDIEQEPGFIKAFHHELYELPNIHVEGYLLLQSPQFRTALLQSAFVICPSCAEGCCSSVLNICGNGGHIPVLTRECAIDLEDFGIPIGDGTIAAVETALLEADSLSDAELDRRLRRSADFFRKEHSREQYHQHMKTAIAAILNEPGCSGAK